MPIDVAVGSKQPDDGFVERSGFRRATGRPELAGATGLREAPVLRRERAAARRLRLRGWRKAGRGGCSCGGPAFWRCSFRVCRGTRNRFVQATLDRNRIESDATNVISRSARAIHLCRTPAPSARRQRRSRRSEPVHDDGDRNGRQDERDTRDRATPHHPGEQHRDCAKRHQRAQPAARFSDLERGRGQRQEVAFAKHGIDIAASETSAIRDRRAAAAR